MSPPHQQPPPLHQQQYHSSGLSPQNSAASLIPSDDRHLDQNRSSTEDLSVEIDPKTGRRRIIGTGTTKAQEPGFGNQSSRAGDSSSTRPVMSDTSAAMPGALPPSPSRDPASANMRPTGSQPIPVSPVRQQYSSTMPAPSPSKLRSGSPRLQSPASSEIFERNVQEPVPMATLQNETPAHIPNHVLTEDHIPAALEASAEAITSSNLNPDEVSIITATSHQPAGASLESSSLVDVASLSAPHLPPVPSLLHQASQESEPSASSGFLHEDDAPPTANYGTLDPNDVRRLSFISFADVVQSEHAQQPEGANSTANLAGMVSSRDLHSPSSSSVYSASAASGLGGPSRTGGVVTPPLTLGQTADQSPVRSIPGPHSPPAAHGELTIETMRQAVRKTASGDLSGVRSTNLSPVGSASAVGEEAFGGRRGRTNT